ncbi:MAG TPA: VWA domain-containing protein [Steroidobacteraceae bacterium]|nr:VWA domain-containing protein [Steroidobacteraceae bacterium]
MSHFHFLHPYWLVALPPLAALAVWLARRRGRDGPWPRLLDGELLPLLRLSEGGAGRSPWLLFGLVWALAVLALAGPSWQRQITPAYRAPAAWVVALELSPSMDAADVAPSRIVRARYAVENLLSAAHDARVGLLAFAGDAYPVAPITSDVATVRNLAQPLSPSLMPESGDRLAPALKEAGRLLHAAPGSDRQVIVLTDGFTDPARALLMARQLRRQGIAVNVVGIGTRSGAPEPDGNGGFVRNAQGQVVLTRLDAGLLQQVAAAGGGHYVPLSALPALIADLHAAGSRELSSGVAAHHVRLASRLNDGVWLLPALLLLAALIARRGWV